MLKDLNPNGSQTKVTDADFNDLLAKCLNQQLGQLDQLIQMTTSKQDQIESKMISTNTNDSYVFKKSKDISNYNKQVNANGLNPLNYDPDAPSKDKKIKEREMQKMEMEKEEDKEINEEISIDILVDKPVEEEEEENEEEEEEIIKPFNKRTRQYKKERFKTELIVKDPLIRRKIKNTKEDNFWNHIAQSCCKPKNILTIAWLKQPGNLDIVEDLRYSCIHGVIAQYIDKSLAPFATWNAETFRGTKRDLMLAKANPIDIDMLINMEQVKPQILFTDKKWKILRYYVEFEPVEIKWKSTANKPLKPIMKLDFEEIDLQEDGKWW